MAKNSRELPFSKDKKEKQREQQQPRMKRSKAGIDHAAPSSREQLTARAFLLVEKGTRDRLYDCDPNKETGASLVLQRAIPWRGLLLK